MVNIYTYNNGRYVLEYLSVAEDEIYSKMDNLFRQGTIPQNIIISDGCDLMCRNMERLWND